MPFERAFTLPLSSDRRLKILIQSSLPGEREIRSPSQRTDNRNSASDVRGPVTSRRSTRERGGRSVVCTAGRDRQPWDLKLAGKVCARVNARRNRALAHYLRVYYIRRPTCLFCRHSLHLKRDTRRVYLDLRDREEEKRGRRGRKRRKRG